MPRKDNRWKFGDWLRLIVVGGFLVWTGIAIDTNRSATTPPRPTNSQPAGASSTLQTKQETQKPSPDLDSAMRICAMLDRLQVAPEKCEVSVWYQTLSWRIAVTPAEAVLYCDAVAKSATDSGLRFDRFWKLMIYSPFSGDHPIASCPLG